MKDCKKGQRWCPIEKKCVPIDDSKQQGKGLGHGKGNGPIGIPKKKIVEGLNSAIAASQQELAMSRAKAKAKAKAKASRKTKQKSTYQGTSPMERQNHKKMIRQMKLKNYLRSKPNPKLGKITDV